MQRSITVIGIVAVTVALAALAGMIIVNDRLEKAVAGTIDQAILSAGRNRLFSYGSVDVQSLRGTVRMNDIVYRQPDMAAVFEATSFSVSAKPWEIVTLVQSGGSSALSEISGALENLQVRFQVDGGAVHLRNGRAMLSGEFTQRVVSEGPQALVSMVETLDASFREITVTPGDRMLQQIQTDRRQNPWLQDEENWIVRSMELKARRDDDSVVVDRFAVDAALVQVRAHGRGTLTTADGPLAEEGKVVVENMHPELRRQVREIGSFYLGIQIPEEGAFTLDYSLDEQGVPRFELE